MLSASTNPSYELHGLAFAFLYQADGISLGFVSQAFMNSTLGLFRNRRSAPPLVSEDTATLQYGKN